MFEAASQAFTAAENAVVSTAVGTAPAVDPDRDEVLYDGTAGNAGGARRGVSGACVMVRWAG